MPTEFTFVRHGETSVHDPDNTTAVVAGGLWDVPLSERGRLQAVSLVETGVLGTLDRIVASGLDRAAATAEPYASAYGIPVHRDSRFNERVYGRFEGPKPADVMRRIRAEGLYPFWYSPFGEEKLPVQGMEGNAELFGKTFTALHDLATAYPGERVGIFGHGDNLAIALRGFGVVDRGITPVFGNGAYMRLVFEVGDSNTPGRVLTVLDQSGITYREATYRPQRRGARVNGRP